MSVECVFEAADRNTFVPTGAAVGAWDAGIIHGAAVGALLAGRLDPPSGTLARLSIDFLAPVPFGPLEVELSEPAGGRRVRRQRAVLRHEGREVALGSSVVVTEGRVELPERAVDDHNPFGANGIPPLREPNRRAAEIVGHESFDSLVTIIDYERVDGDRRLHQWISLALPIIGGTEPSGAELVAVAADYGQGAVHRVLPMADWSFRNAEQTLHLSRPATGRWVGVRCESVAQPLGAGFNTADLFDQAGRFGRSAAAIVLEHR